MVTAYTASDVHIRDAEHGDGFANRFRALRKRGGEFIRVAAFSRRPGEKDDAFAHGSNVSPITEIMRQVYHMFWHVSHP